MIPLPPNDPTLPGIPVAWDGEAMAGVLDKAFEEVTVLASRPYYVKYKPGGYCRVQYRLEVLDEQGLRSSLPAHVSLHPWGRVEKLAMRHGLMDGSGRRPPRAGLVPELHGIAQLFPVDFALPGLIVASSPEALSRRFERKGLNGDPHGCEVELIRYKAQKRAVLRYLLRESPVGSIYGKLRKDRGGSLPRIAEAIRRAGVPTPRVLGHLADVGMILQLAGPGDRLRELRGTPEYERWMPSVAGALVRLHEAEVAGLPRYSPETEAGELRAAAKMVAALLPELGPQPDALAERLGASLVAIDEARSPIHGSFHDDQVLVADQGVTLIDLDGARMGNPLADVGHFLSYLSAEGDVNAYERFLGSYLWARPAGGGDHLVFEAASLLRWATLPFRELRPDWPEAVERRVRLAGARLDAHSRT